jgi:hypothetical protein
MANTSAGAVIQVIQLRLEQIDDLFQMPQSDLFSEYRNYLTGIDYCISELRSHVHHGPVRIEIDLLNGEVTDDTNHKVAGAMRRYCDHRLSYNGRERRAVRLDGISSFRIGVPVALVGLFIMVEAARIEDQASAIAIATSHIGFVLAWVGLWFPLDTMLFYPLAYSREDRVLECLRDAEIVVRAAT